MKYDKSFPEEYDRYQTYCMEEQRLSLENAKTLKGHIYKINSAISDEEMATNNCYTLSKLFRERMGNPVKRTSTTYDKRAIRTWQQFKGYEVCE